MTIYDNKEISLIDTNVLVYAADKTSEFHLSAKNSNSCKLINQKFIFSSGYSKV